MKRGLLLASAASFLGATVLAGARAADLPARQAAPIEYVRICDAYGAGFFYIPGTDTCFRAGGLALAELRGFDPSFSIVGPFFFGTGTPHPASGFVPSPTFGFAVQGGVQLNADYLSPGDKLWLQAAYEKGAFGYIAGSNYAFSYGARSVKTGFRAPAARRWITAAVGTRRSIPTAFSPAVAAANSNGAGISPGPISIIGSRS
jgi:Porin subfamily